MNQDEEKYLLLKNMLIQSSVTYAYRGIFFLSNIYLNCRMKSNMV